ncbi:hippurate hydrolase [Capronia epimyces CBS 606.96]|uniref:Hippurate hydrolase n=1 Tax=Capronia epimyces CBS 606.96 TaxID=1182542 RepID=W9XIR0_9EURO|nr:hippurate hydrolase [Capronia epimyces CBS 606.96]EXJ80108.1 hippurate hydrolase [Capronia epimyces CBS 606.96]
MHITCLLAATDILVTKARDQWCGTLIVLFQPAEERGTGALAMIADGLSNKIPKPDYLFGQHIVANLPAGMIGLRNDTIMAGAESMRCKIHGRGGHASQPHRLIDAGVLAANCVIRLQQIVSRELAPSETAVVTAVPLSAAAAENIIPNDLELGIDIRFVTSSTRDQLLKSIYRIINAECQASNAPQPPEFTTTRRFPLTINDLKTTNLLKGGFAEHFGPMFNPEITVSTIAEDFPYLAQGQPYVFWHLGCSDSTTFDLEGRHDSDLPPVPMNHSSGFKPLIQPTLRAGIEALLIAALTCFRRPLVPSL